MSKRFIIVLMLMACGLSVLAQEVNKKYAWTTQMFLDELKENSEQQVQGPRHAPVRRQLDGKPLPKTRRLIASPDTVSGVAYISCFIHLKDVNSLGDVRALGVEVEETFDGLDFITARVPVSQLESLAAIDNVTNIKVAQLMSPSTDVARQLTNVDDLLTQSSDALSAGVASKYDGTGVILGIIDTGIDFQHIAFKDKDGNSRIKRAYVYTGSDSGAEYTDISSVETDDNTEDHGTHTASTAGGSSVIVTKNNNTNFTINVTDNHASATYGGMAPGADLYLAGVKNLPDTELANALKKMVAYADDQNKPLVVSNSWGSGWGPRDGTGEWAELVGMHFGDTHPNHVILFASSNDAGHTKDNEGGGFFVRKSSASSSSPLGTILRSDYDSEHDAGDYYHGSVSMAWSTKPLNYKIYILNSLTGEVLKTWNKSSSTNSFDGIDIYYWGTLTVSKSTTPDDNSGKYYLRVSASQLESKLKTETTKNNKTYFKSNYTLAIEIYPNDGEANIDMWAGNYTYFTNHLMTTDHTWIAGTDDMCVSDEATIPDAISVGAYMSRNSWPNYEGYYYQYISANSNGDIADFSSYATAEQSPTGKAYPWITAPGAAVIAGVNHYHTASDEGSYFYSDNKGSLVVNNADNPYGKMQGTSMSTPVAAGIVALWLQAAKEVGKSLTVNDVKTIMQETAIRDSYVTTGANASHFGVNGKIDALAGIQYIFNHYGKLELANGSSNATDISTASSSGKEYQVTLANRTLYKDGGWNTLCLPFNVTLSNSPLADADVRTLDNANLTDGKLTLNFTAENGINELVAGTPYIIKWAKADGYDQASEETRDIKNPVFEGVTIDATDRKFISTDGKVIFKGNYDAQTFTDTNTSILFLGENNTLYWPENGASIGACRAYFQLSDGQSASEFVLNFEENTGTTGITNTNLTNRTNKDSHNSCSENNAWYTMDGRQLVGKPSAKGVYIHAGKKVVITNN